MRRAVVEYGRALGKWGWILIVDIFSGIVGVFQMAKPNYSVGWTLLVITSVIVLLSANFFVFYQIMGERDGLRKKLETEEMRGMAAAILERAKTQGNIILNELVLNLEAASKTDGFSPYLQKIYDWECDHNNEMMKLNAQWGSRLNAAQRALRNPSNIEGLMTAINGRLETIDAMLVSLGTH